MNDYQQKIPKRVQRVIRLLRDSGATECMLVGGFVRDLLLGIDSKDIDVEVYGLGYDQIVEILRPHYRVDLVGRSFGVLKIGNWLDINIPRRESKCGVGHKGFSVQSDPTMTPYEATSRRDFTINAIGLRVDGTFYDPFDGRGDIERGLLRATTDAFCEDPLRVLRGMQFAGRLGYRMDEQTIERCRGMIDEFDTLSPERVWEEWRKWAVKSRFPSRGLELLKQTDWIRHFPAIAAMDGVQQNPHWHPEGDVLTHTLHVCDQACRIAEREQLDEHDRTILMFAALCHDFGKPESTVQDQRGRWVSPEHECAGEEPTREFFQRMRAPNWVAEHVVPLVRCHMAMVHCHQDIPSERAVRRLAVRLMPSSIRMWAMLSEADSKGRPAPDDHSLSTGPLSIAPWLEIAGRLAVRDRQPEPIVMGRHLIEQGVRPGPEMGNLVKQAYEAQLDGEFTDLDGGLQWARRRLGL